MKVVSGRFGLTGARSWARRAVLFVGLATLAASIVGLRDRAFAAGEGGSETKSKNMAGLELAFVDMQAAILKTEEGREAKVRIEKEAQSKREELVSQQEELNKMGQEFQAQQSVLSSASQLEKQREIQMKIQNLRNSQLMFEQEVRRKEMEETQKIIENLQKIIDEVAKKKGYDLVFERGSGALLYASTIDDITTDVVDIYNSRHKSTGGDKTADATKKKDKK